MKNSNKLTLGYHLFIDWNPTGFFPFIRKLTFFNARSLILSIRILIISWSWSLLGSRSWIILAIPLLRNDIDEIIFSVLFENVKGSLLELFIKKHCSTKKFSISTFSLMSVTYLFLWFKDGMERISYSKTSKLTNRVMYRSFDQPTYLVNGSSIFVYWIHFILETFNFVKSFWVFVFFNISFINFIFL